MILPKKDTILHDSFVVGITIRGIYGLLELIGGIILFFRGSEPVVRIVAALFRHELAHDPTDMIANYSVNASQHLSQSTIEFLAIYLLIQGIVKVGLVTALWLKKVWAYPLAGVVLTVLVVYQIIRLFKTHSKLLFFFTLLDIMILALLHSEYGRVIKHTKVASRPHKAFKQ